MALFTNFIFQLFVVTFILTLYPATLLNLIISPSHCSVDFFDVLMYRMIPSMTKAFFFFVLSNWYELFKLKLQV